MSLRDYVRKRRLSETPEPRPGKLAPTTRHLPIFVVQLHHARARHYDFRLEVGGVLKSWAVPKGPSLRAGERRLAVEVEDHPVSYAAFEGDIPPGHYGAGHVDLFDRGTWKAQGDPESALKAGKLEFELNGSRLQGQWKLVRTAMSGNKMQWLLIKSRDAHARDATADDLLDEPVAKSVDRALPNKPKSSVDSSRMPKTRARDKSPRNDSIRKLAAALPGASTHAVPDRFRPELCILRAVSPEGEGWLHEVKWDGYRLLASIEKGKVALRSRNDLEWTKDFPTIVHALKTLSLDQAQFDGELVVLDAKGQSDFSALQHEIKVGGTGNLSYLIFDLLAIEGINLTQCRLADRKTILDQVLARRPHPALALSKHVIGHGAFVFEASRKQGLEGIVSKRVDSYYAAGRTGDWVKAKHALSDDFIIVGMTKPKGAREGFGALLMARRVERNLEYVGRVGTGYDDAMLQRLATAFKPLVQSSPTVRLPAHTPLKERDVTWLLPVMIAEVAFRGWAKEGLLRQASFLRLREDKDAVDITSADTEEGGDKMKEDAGKKSKGRTATGATHASAKITHSERLVYRSARISKGQVAAYYEAISPMLLHEIGRRPLSVVRCPDGADGKSFFQKHYAKTLGKNVDAIAIHEADGGEQKYIAVHDTAGVLDLVQMNVLEFHPWGCASGRPKQPDRLVFDLDPAEDVSWKEIVRAARDVRARLQDTGLESFVRLSGGKGVHVVAPIASGPDWDEAKAFCRAFATAMATAQPERYLATASKALRTGRIFIDWLRNGRGATSVASWSLRARAGAPVAMPIQWSGLDRIKAANAYDLTKALEAFERGVQPWQLSEHPSQKLPKVASAD